MNLFEQRDTLRLTLLAIALLIICASLIFTHFLTRDLAEQERKKVELWANAYKNLNQADENTDLGFLFEVIKNNQTVPVILTDEDFNIMAWRNFDSLKVVSDPDYLQSELDKIRLERKPLIIQVAEGINNYIFYKDSYPLIRLRYFPFVQIGIILLFSVVAYVSFSTSRRAEQNRVWVGMAKETAHQLGTPISSLMAWLEYLKESEQSKELQNVIIEIEKDLNRLELVAERFSKIGSTPALELKSLDEVLRRSLDYMKRRSSEQVTYSIDTGNGVLVNINQALFDWVIENLLKNALDAMEGKGTITVKAFEENGKAIIDIKDTGKGIPKSKFKKVFEPGYSSKKRGWGLGLTLAKRIIEQYHNGHIFVRESTLGSGSTFRIVLPIPEDK